MQLLRFSCGTGAGTDNLVLVFLLPVLLHIISGMLDILFSISGGALIQTINTLFPNVYKQSFLCEVSFTFVSQLHRRFDIFGSSGF